ncbi:hypothetical protein JHK82_035772 [Glycine max]|uniref:Protein GLUTAMINE DUMPER 3 n=3 Tax=Glycine subgen. Soja TaxID=1462606 RepID=K7LWX0_SOYBN|nr:hypothetical protein JHK87_035695 [Glycine soja]KAG4970075.1 hypothetical protein JHK85_036496 [Glycine max]KAG4976430.1 hypothetical protein JHK86_035904 [Glycine max]KAG5112503.1 hypothetical protein JHK82_035772 [Glycine max]KAG5129778.1 hypothetical protein JHK84_036175 [Glycine max]
MIILSSTGKLIKGRAHREEGGGSHCFFLLKKNDDTNHLSPHNQNLSINTFPPHHPPPNPINLSLQFLLSIILLCFSQSNMAAYREPMNMNMSDRAPVSPQQPHSPWHSPVPYLFGGLAAMLGLIAFALLILACSYWKLSGYLEGNGETERDLEAGETEQDQKPAKPYEEKILVIMAGQEKPTFLATPSVSSCSTSRSSSFGDNTSTCTCEENRKSLEMAQAGTGTTETAHSSSD